MRYVSFIYGVTAHAAFLGVFAYMAGFVGNILVPRSIDHGLAGPITEAVAIDLFLIAVFGLQHSIMARPGFKAVWVRIVPPEIERSTYVWISNVLVAVLIWQWRPIEAVVWDVTWPAGRAALMALFAAGWLLVPLASLMINHFDLFGTRQVWLHLRGDPYRPLSFTSPLLYRVVRHPLYVGWMIAFWATPTMTVGHLLFAGAMTAYILIAVLFEERDLGHVYGETYAAYRRRVPAFIPRLRGAAGAQAAPARVPASRVGGSREAVASTVSGGIR